VDIQLTEQQEGIVRWLRGEVSRGIDRPIYLKTDYREESPSYLGENLDEMLEQAVEDYASWDETIPF
jgi:hypothetical protein